jgi:cytochrome c oxidase subunit II
MRQAKHKRTRRARQRQTIGGILFAAIVVATLSLAGLLIRDALWGPRLPALAGTAVDVRGSMGGFSPATIRVPAGEPVTLRLISMDSPLHQGGGEHQLAIDELEIDLRAAARESAAVTFTPTTPGVYQFYCDVCCGGRLSPSMQGSFIVEA